jgi:hypothetical protein
LLELGCREPYSAEHPEPLQSTKTRTSSLHAVKVDQVGSSDSEQFAERKIPRITVHSLTQETWNERILHSKKDKLAQIRFDDYYQTYRLMAAYLTFLDQILPTQEVVAPH